MKKLKVIRTSTVPSSLNILLKGQLKFLNQYYEIIAVSGSGIDLDSVHKREIVRVIPIEMERKISLIRDFLVLIKMYFLFVKEKPFIVHSITPKAGLVTMIAAYLARVPIRIHTFTGLMFPSKTGFFKWLLISMDKLICRAATNIFPEGEGVKNELQQFSITDKPLKVIGNGNINGIDVSYFDTIHFTLDEKNNLKTSLGINENDFVFIFVGRLVGDKGINELVNAFTTLKSKNCKLLLVGSFEHDLDPLQRDTLLEIQNNPDIITVGFKEDVRPFFSISDCLVFPSFREGFPNVVIQAGAMGLASIVTNINGCNEIIKDGVNGIIIPSKDKNALIEAMNYVITNTNELKQMAFNARPLIVNRYEQNYVWKSILYEYKSLENKLLH